MSPDEFSDKSPGRLEPTTFREHRAGTYRDVSGFGFVPDLLPPEIDARAIRDATHDQVLAAERALSYLDGVASQAENPALLISPFQQREARLSSAIENTFASAQQMALFNADPSAVDEGKRGDVKEVTNYVSALHHGFTATEPICIRLIKRLHGILLEGVDRGAGRKGDFRNTQNAIGQIGASFETARFVPPPPRYLSELMQNWEVYAHQPKDELPRLVRFAVAHYQFECIHPFDDGNGRIGRLLIALQLCETAQLSKPFVYISEYFERYRTTYYDLLYNVSTKGEWTRWIRFFLEAIAEQASDAATKYNQLAKLRASYHMRVRQKRASALLPDVIDGLFSVPALTVTSVCQRSNITPQAASALVKRLVEHQIIIEATGRKSHRVYVAPAILDIID